MADDSKNEEPERIGIFPSWRWLYAAVIAYTILLTGVLYLLSITLDPGIQ